MAEWTGLEPATSGVTGQHSNRLNYHSAETIMITVAGCARNTFCAVIDGDDACALPLLVLSKVLPAFLVGTEGIEPPTRSV